jgi:hypothetical protein
MSGPETAHEDLRRAFAATFRTADDGKNCPPPEGIWESAHAHLARREDDDVIRHVGECSACAAAWRAARELEGEAAAGEVRSTAPRVRWGTRVSWVAAAAAVLAVALIWSPGLFDRTDRQPTFRAWEGDWLQPAFEESTPLPKEDCVLRWTAGPEGTTYEVRVTGEDLALLTVGRNLAQPEFQVPEEAIAGLAPESSIFWQVTARLPQGRTVESVSFVTPLK